MPRSDFEEAFSIYRDALSEIIQAAFGWDEEFQRNRFQTRYRPEWFYWIEVDSKYVGYACINNTQDELHVSLLIILKEHRGHSIGEAAMKLLQQRARDNSQRVTLSSFKNNTGAVRFYQRLGYEIASEDGHFYDMVLKNP